DSVVARRVPGEGPPAATELQNLHPRPQAELAAHQIELGVLRLVEVDGPVPVRAGVGERRSEHRLVEVVPDVVVAGDRSSRTDGALEIAEPGRGEVDGATPAGQRPLHPGADQPRGELVQRSRVPLAVDAGLAQAEPRGAGEAQVAAGD